MANIMMPLISKSAAPGNAPDPKNQIEPGREASFSKYMDKKIRKEESESRDKLGVKDTASPQKTADSENVETKDTSEMTALQQLMADLQNLITDDNSKAGEWTFNLEGSGILDTLAGYAGMDDSGLALLKKQMEEQGGLSLSDLFAALKDQFAKMNEDLQVTVPETDLAFIETLLSKMGVSADDLSTISDQSVNGLSEFDLIACLQALGKIGGEDTGVITLTGWELDQLQSMLEDAGISKESLQNLVPEANLALKDSLEALGLSSQDGADVQLSLDRLKNLLEQAIADADAAAKSKVNVSGFLDELKGMLSQAGFEGKGVGWTPVVQESLTTAYQELQKMVDLSKVKVEKINDIQRLEEGLTQDWLNSTPKLKAPSDEALLTKTTESPSLLLDGQTEMPLEQEGVVKSASVKESDKFLNTFLTQLNSSLPETPAQGTDQRPNVDTLRLPPMRTPLGPEMQQFSIDQISQGLVRGLRNNQHHLTLTLHPKELGEVKVDMQIRQSHISVSFVMENSRVKEALESNMSDFKDNLNRQGFSLQECFVSVDQNDSENARQRFEEAWERMVGQSGYEKDQGLPHEIVGLVGDRVMASHPGSTISLFV